MDVSIHFIHITRMHAYFLPLSLLRCPLTRSCSKPRSDAHPNCYLYPPSLTPGGFDKHAAFAIMHLYPSPNRAFLCVTTESSRNIIFEVLLKSKITNDNDNTNDRGCDIVQDLYGHKNDGTVSPGWPSNGQY